MPEPGKKKRTRKSTARAAEIALAERAEVPVEPLRDEATDHQEPAASIVVAPTTAPEQTTEISLEEGLGSLLLDNGFMDQMVLEMTQTEALKTLAADTADKIKEALERNPEFRQRLLNAVVSTETFKRKLARKIIGK